MQGSGSIYASKIQAGTTDSLAITGVDKFFKFTNSARFIFGVLDIDSKFFANKFIDISDVSNTSPSFTIANQLIGSKIRMTGRYFIDTNQSTLTVEMPNSLVTGFLNKSVTVVTIVPNTQGTLSVIFGNSVISGVNDYVDDATAIAAGLITNALYYNTTTEGLKTL